MKCRFKVGEVWSDTRFPMVIVRIPLLPGLSEQPSMWVMSDNQAILVVVKFCDSLLSQFDPCIHCHHIQRGFVTGGCSAETATLLPRLLAQALHTKELVQACTCSSSVHPHHLCGWGVWSYRCIRAVVGGKKGGWLTVNHMHRWSAYVDCWRFGSTYHQKKEKITLSWW